MLEKAFHWGEVEAGRQCCWLDSGASEADTRAAAASCTIMMPPAKVTGSPRIGHAPASVIQDHPVRCRRMLARSCEERSAGGFLTQLQRLDAA
jgi:valyl-tRNA synthetase